MCINVIQPPQVFGILFPRSVENLVDTEVPTETMAENKQISPFSPSNIGKPDSLKQAEIVCVIGQFNIPPIQC